MPKLIVDYEEGIELGEVLSLLRIVTSQGRISHSRGVDKFSHVTIIDRKFEVIAKDRKPTHYPDSFTIKLRNNVNE